VDLTCSPKRISKPANSFMSRIFKFKSLLLAFAVASATNHVSAFSLLGPVDGFQTERIGYDLAGPIGSDIGGPMNLGEEYRFNLKVITYGFDSTFKNYFGQRGMEEVRKAMAILNALPPMSKASRDLREFPTDTRRVNFRASAFGLLDLKSYALAAMVEQLGLASPERFTWSIRTRYVPAPFAYDVIKRNFDPVTLAPSSYVNDTLYTYFIPPDDPMLGLPRDVIDALELPVDPQAFQFTSVASVLGVWAFQPGGILLSGDFLTGLTRDDVGGLRYIYAGKGPYVNYNMETLVSDALTNTISSGGAWAPVGSNTVVTAGLRPGIDKLTFREARYDSVLGPFIITTNTYKDTYILGSRKRKQTYQRVLAQPDIIFGAADLSLSILSRSITNSINNAELNGQVILAGPGVLDTPVFIIFNKIGPVFENFQFDFLDEQTASFNFVWGSFDGTTNEPFVYPNGATIQELEQRVLRGN
jgi:hypothetical protein